MSITAYSDHDEAQAILDALRKIQDTPELRDEAKISPESVVNRLGLTGVAQHAVAFAITGLAVLPIATAQMAHPQHFWS